ncbi:unnamed protein product [[Candida] boidinii]|nr:unnamed protein product [[Candida] boidinii]
MLIKTNQPFLTINQGPNLLPQFNLEPQAQKYILDVQIKFYDLPITVCAIYVPVYKTSSANPYGPISQKEFLNEFYRILPNLTDDDVIIAGDWNTSPMELPTTNEDIQLHHKLNTYQFHDIYPISSPKKKKINYTNITSAQHTNRRLDRIYISHSLYLKCNSHYGTLARFSFSTHLPVKITFYFNKNSNNNSNVNKDNIIIPYKNGNYHHRAKLMDTQLLKDPQILSYVFRPTIIDQSQPLNSYELFVKKVQTRYKLVSKQINSVECRSSQLVESMTLYQKFNLKLEQINRMK